MRKKRVQGGTCTLHYYMYFTERQWVQFLVRFFTGAIYCIATDIIRLCKIGCTFAVENFEKKLSAEVLFDLKFIIL